MIKRFVVPVIAAMLFSPLAQSRTDIAFANAQAGSTIARARAAALLKNMKVAVASDSSHAERRTVAVKLRQTVANMNPAERVIMVDELISMVDQAMNHQLVTVKAFELPTFIVAMSGLSQLLSLSPQRISGTRSAAGLVLLGGAVWVQLEYLNQDNIELHASQLRSELFALRRSIEMSQASARLN